MPPKKKGQGDDEAEACPADMDPEVWAVVKDVNQLVALASKKTSAPPVTRFDALLHLWSAVASKPRERDALVDAGALAQQGVHEGVVEQIEQGLARRGSSLFGIGGGTSSERDPWAGPAATR